MIMTSMNRGGMETFTMNMYRNMDRCKIQFDFLVHREIEGDYDEEIRLLGGKIYHIRRQNPLDPCYWRDLNAFFGEHPYRVVHAQLDCMSAEPLAAAARHGAAVRIAHSHNSRQDRDLKYPLKLACKRLIKREATDLFACGVEAGRWMFGTDDFTVVRNAIDVGAYAFDPGRRERVRRGLGLSGGACVVGHVGRFRPVKNQGFLVRAFAELLRLRPDAVLLLAGDGDGRPACESLAAGLGVSGSVRFLGVRSDVPDLMQAMDVFVMPSLYEGLPLVLVEAQAAGLPCLVSDSIPGDCDIEGGSVSRMSLRKSPSEWALRLEELLASPLDRVLGESAVRAGGFDAREQARKLQEFYLRRAGVTVEG